MKRVYIIVVSLFLAVFFPVEVAFTHPHAWIDGKLTFVAEQGKIIGVKAQWLLDDFNSMAIIEDADKNKNGTLEPKESQHIYNTAFINLAGQNYLTDIRINGQKESILGVNSFKASVDKGLLRYDFYIPLTTAVDPRKSKLTASLYDKTYFIDMVFVQNAPIAFQGLQGVKCSYSIKNDASNKIFMGMVEPQKASITCQ